MQYKIIASGSTGNAVLIEDVLIDCGVNFKDIKEHLYKVRYLFYTHIHGDHFKLSTFKAIKRQFPNIDIYANADIAYKVGINNLKKVLIDGSVYKVENKEIKVFSCVHDVECFGFYININKDTDILYATDTTSLAYAPNIKYDYMFIESNHDENKINAMMNNSKYGYDVYSNAKRHLSTQQSKAYYYMHKKNKNSKWIELHKSERFY